MSVQNSVSQPRMIEYSYLKENFHPINISRVYEGWNSLTWTKRHHPLSYQIKPISMTFICKHLFVLNQAYMSHIICGYPGQI